MLKIECAQIKLEESMDNQDRRLAVEIAIVSLVMSMGVASMIYSNSIRLTLDVYKWSLNGTEINPAIQEEFTKYKRQILDETIFGLIFILGGFGYLIRMYFRYKR